MLAAFILPNIAGFLLSIVRPCQDCLKQLGWPFVFFEEGGIAWRRNFDSIALCWDIAIALIVSAVWAFAYEKRLEITRYLIREIRASWEDFRRKLH